MVEEVSFDGLVDAADLEFLENNLAMDSLGLITVGESSDLVGGIEEVTLPVDEVKFFPFFHTFPPTQPRSLCTSDYEGPFKFEVLIDPSNLRNNSWEYSPSLNKIYIDMKHKFPINFSVDTGSGKEAENLFVRVIPIFQQDRFFQEVVHRCVCHELPEDPLNQGVHESITQHIIRCYNDNCRYFGDKNVNQRLNIVIPLGTPQPGTDSTKEFFMFVCKNSCVNGMNRRPIQIVFHLENHQGIVLGRRLLSVRICSCPKRDREKEERKSEKPSGTKKRKMEKPQPGDEEAGNIREFKTLDAKTNSTRGHTTTCPPSGKPGSQPKKGALL